jgi:hypothetical protein
MVQSLLRKNQAPGEFVGVTGSMYPLDSLWQRHGPF